MSYLKWKKHVFVEGGVYISYYGSICIPISKLDHSWTESSIYYHIHEHWKFHVRPYNERVPRHQPDPNTNPEVTLDRTDRPFSAPLHHPKPITPDHNPNNPHTPIHPWSISNLPPTTKPPISECHTQLPYEWNIPQPKYEWITPQPKYEWNTS